MSFRRPDWENPVIDNPDITDSSLTDLEHEHQVGCAPSVCTPEPGVWTWGPPVPSPSLKKAQKEEG
ncbi:MAG: hypothetical protein ACOYD5_04400 [Negativicutes bacterium]|jgi:hypothetical protein